MTHAPFIVPIEHRITQVFELAKRLLAHRVLLYSTIVLLRDGRGYTCGWAGFTSADEEVVLCVEAYTRRVPGNHLSGAILEELRRLRDEGSGDTKELDLLAFRMHWANAASRSEFQDAYEEVVHQIFGLPAQSHCAALNLKTPVARAILLDTVIEHGDDGDKDSTGAIIERTQQNHGAHLEEQEFLRAFLIERRKTLLKPHNRETAKDWRESATRVDALENLRATNPELRLPVRIKSADYDERII